jgi:shikimate kinase
VTRVLITGMSGAGKSTVLAELRARGHRTLDTDYGEWVMPDGRWDETRMARFLDDNPHVFVSGTVDNQGVFYDRFEHVVLLSAPLAVITERVARRTNNPYGRTAAERAQIRADLENVEPRLRRGCSVELDGRRPVAELADELERLMAC